MSSVLEQYDALTSREALAWDAFRLTRARSFVEYGDGTAWPPKMGKAECEWVSFEEFWLGKCVELGWVIVKYSPWRDAPTEGIRARTIELIVTERGKEVWEAVENRYLQRRGEMDD